MRYALAHWAGSGVPARVENGVVVDPGDPYRPDCVLTGSWSAVDFRPHLDACLVVAHDTTDPIVGAVVDLGNTPEGMVAPPGPVIAAVRREWPGIPAGGGTLGDLLGLVLAADLQPDPGTRGRRRRLELDGVTLFDQAAISGGATDNFDRANGAPGNGWTLSSSDVQIRSNRLTAGCVYTYAYSDAYQSVSTSNNYIQAEWRCTTGSGWEMAMLQARRSNGNNYYAAQLFAGGDIKLVKVVSGAETTLGTNTANLPRNGTTVTVKITVEGSSLRVYRDGSSILGPTTDTALASGTTVALWWNVSAAEAVTFDNADWNDISSVIRNDLTIITSGVSAPVAIVPTPAGITASTSPVTATAAAVAVAPTPGALTITATPVTGSSAVVPLAVTPDPILTDLSPVTATAAAVAVAPTPGALTIAATPVTGDAAVVATAPVVGSFITVWGIDATGQPVTLTPTPGALTIAATPVDGDPAVVALYPRFILALTPADGSAAAIVLGLTAADLTVNLDIPYATAQAVAFSSEGGVTAARGNVEIRSVWQVVLVNGAQSVVVPRWTGLRLTKLLGGADKAQFTVSGFGPVVSWLNEYATDVLIRRNDVTMFRGRLMPLDQTLTAEDHQVSVQAVGYEELLNARFLWEQKVYDDVDQGAIAWDLIDYTQGLDNGSLGITLGTVASAKLRDRTYEAGQNIGGLISALGQVIDGFDWWIDPDLKFNITAPRRGADLSGAVFLVYGSTVSSARRSPRAQGYANAVQAVGAPDTNGVAVWAGAENTDDPAHPGVPDPRGRWESQVQYQSTATPSVLEDHALWSVTQMRSPRRDFQVTITPGRWGADVSCDVGDVVRLIVPRFSVNGAVRVHEIEFGVDVGGQEAIRLALVEETSLVAGSLPTSRLRGVDQLADDLAAIRRRVR